MLSVVAELLVGTGDGLRVSKIRRLSQPDDKLANGIDYTFVEHSSKFLADDATLRFTFLFLLIIIIIIQHFYSAYRVRGYRGAVLFVLAVDFTPCL